MCKFFIVLLWCCLLIPIETGIPIRIKMPKVSFSVAKFKLPKFKFETNFKKFSFDKHFADMAKIDKTILESKNLIESLSKSQWYMQNFEREMLSINRALKNAEARNLNNQAMLKQKYGIDIKNINEILRGNKVGLEKAGFKKIELPKNINEKNMNGILKKNEIELKNQAHTDKNMFKKDPLLLEKDLTKKNIETENVYEILKKKPNEVEFNDPQLTKKDVSHTLDEELSRKKLELETIEENLNKQLMKKKDSSLVDKELNKNMVESKNKDGGVIKEKEEVQHLDKQSTKKDTPEIVDEKLSKKPKSEKIDKNNPTSKTNPTKTNESPKVKSKTKVSKIIKKEIKKEVKKQLKKCAKKLGKEIYSELFERSTNNSTNNKTIIQKSLEMMFNVCVLKQSKGNETSENKSDEKWNPMEMMQYSHLARSDKMFKKMLKKGVKKAVKEIKNEFDNHNSTSSSEKNTAGVKSSSNSTDLITYQDFDSHNSTITFDKTNKENKTNGLKSTPSYYTDVKIKQYFSKNSTISLKENSTLLLNKTNEAATFTNASLRNSAPILKYNKVNEIGFSSIMFIFVLKLQVLIL